jgi:multidrug efflux pump subunit AcrA (membrane-fusion protein)
MITLIGAPAHAQFSSALDESQATANEAKASQQRIDQLDDQTAALLNDYRANLKQLDAARRYNASLQRNIEAQERSKVRLAADIENVGVLQRAMLPLMEDMLKTFGELVGADVPFDIAGRQQRVNNLLGVMDNPEVSVAQRYRLIVEAYQIEMEFGRTIGTYAGSIDDNGQERSGEFLRVGRIALIFKTGDDSVLKIWDTGQGGWADLNKSYLPDVRLGLRMAKEQTAPSLLPVPVKAPTRAATE